MAINVAQLKQQQLALALQVKLQPLPQNINLIGGADCSISGDNAFAVFVIYNMAAKQVVEYVTASAPLPLPYIPGLLAFREIPALHLAYAKLQIKPEVTLVDGHGIAHPRRLGIASHLGVTLGIPTVGVAKSLLSGSYNAADLAETGQTELIDKDAQTGWVLTTKPRTKPIFVSPGHLCTLADTNMLVQQLLVGHRLPEPTFIADKLSKQLKVGATV
jgi:deoxyribonuclease V